MRAILISLALSGCAVANHPVVDTPASPIAPQTVANRPEMVWFKRGASAEDFQRAKAGCIVQAEAGSGGNPLVWTAIFPNCLRAQGWVLIPKSR